MYLFLAGLGGGAFVTSFVIGRTAPKAASLRRFGHYLAFIVVAIGLVLLMVDARAGFLNPLRFALLLTNFGSVMTWGVVFLALFMIIDLVVCILDIKKAPIPFGLDLAGAIISVCVAIYTGALLGVAHTFPLWNSALLPILFLVSAMSTGAAAVLFFGALVHREELGLLHFTEKVHYFFPIAEIVLVAALLFITFSNGEAGRNSVLVLVCGKYAPAFWFGFVIIGLVLPFVLETYKLFGAKKNVVAAKEPDAGAGLTLVGDAGVIIGGFLLRYLILVAALPVTMTVAATL